MGILFLSSILLHFLMTGCGGLEEEARPSTQSAATEELSSDTDKTLKDGWYGSRIDEFIDSCVYSSMDSGASYTQAGIYCLCVSNEITTSYSYQQLLANSSAIINELDKNGTYDRCRNESKRYD